MCFGSAAGCVSALPPDVRRGDTAPLNLELGDGLRPRFGLARIFHWAKGRTKGPALRSMETSDGAAQPRLTSGGRAVSSESKVHLGQSQSNSQTVKLKTSAL